MAVVVLTAGIVVGIRPLFEHSGGVIDVVSNVDTQTAAFQPSAISSLVRRDARAMAAAGGGTLSTWVGAGSPAKLVNSTSLTVERDGRLDGNDKLRDAAVDSRVAGVLSKLSRATATGSGRSLWALFSPLQKPAGGASWIVYVVTFGMPTLEAENSSVLLAADPSAAVASLPASVIPDLSGAEVHMVFAPPAGGQPVLNARTSAWRAAYVTDYVTRSGGKVVDTTTLGGTGTAIPKAASVPVIANVLDSVWLPPVGSLSSTTVVASLDAGSLFAPDSARLLDPDQLKAALAPLAAAWKTGKYTRPAECVARAAKYGPAGVARTLTGERALVGVAMLNQLGAPGVGTGLGYDDPLPGFASTAAEQRSILCTLSQ